MTRTRILSVTTLVLLVAGCSSPEPGGNGGASGASGCPAAPTTCPTPAPAYAADVAGIVASRCVSCHGPGGVEQQRPLGTYAALASRRSSVLTQLATCAMPKDASMSDGERATVLAWIVCGAPND